MSTFMKIQLDKIQTDDRNQPRVNIYVDDLTESIKTLGLLNPIVVTPIPEGNPGYRLIDGHRRLQAFKAAGVSNEIDALILDNRGAVNEYLFALAANAQREQLTDEEIKEYTQLRLLDMDPDKVAAASNLPVGDIRKAAAARARLNNKDLQLSMDQLIMLAKYKDNPDAEAIISAYDAADFARQSWVAENDIKKAQKSREARAKAEALGIKFYESFNWATMSYTDNDRAYYTEDNPCGCDAFGLVPSYSDVDFVCGNKANHVTDDAVEVAEDPDRIAGDQMRERQLAASEVRLDMLKAYFANSTYQELIPSLIIDVAISAIAAYGVATDAFGEDSDIRLSLKQPGEIVMLGVKELEDIITHGIRRTGWSGGKLADAPEILADNTAHLPLIVRYLETLTKYWKLFEARLGLMTDEKADLIQLQNLYIKALIILEDEKKAAEEEADDE